MTTEELEDRIRTVHLSQLSTSLKARVLAHACHQPHSSTLPPRWLTASLAALWLMIALLHSLTPDAANSSFTRTTLSKDGTGSSLPSATANPVSLFATTSYSFASYIQ